VEFFAIDVGLAFVSLVAYRTLAVLARRRAAAPASAHRIRSRTGTDPLGRA
jgi:hypothetical protein